MNKKKLPSKSLKEQAKKLGIRLTTKKGKKSSEMLRGQVQRKKSKKKTSFGKKNPVINFNASHTPGVGPLIMPGSRGLGVGYYGKGYGVTRTIV